MKNQREIYEALLAGETLVNNRGQRQSLNEKGELRNDLVDMSDPDEWQIHKEPKWYENIPEGGVLCWVKDEDGEPFFRINVIFERKGDFYKSKHLAYHYAKPLTKQEIQVFMENAPNE